MSDNFNQETGEIIEEETAEEKSSLEYFKEKLLREHNQVLSKEDPIFILFSMHEAFLEDYEELAENRDKQVKKIIKNTGNVLSKQIEKTFLELKDKAAMDNLVNAGASIEKIKSVLEAGAEHLNKTRKTILWATAAMWLAAVPVFIILLLLLIK